MYKKQVEVLKHLKENLKEYSTFLLILFVGFIAAWFALNGFIELTDEVLDKEMRSFDNSISEMVYNTRSPLLNKLMLHITTLGDRPAYFILIPLCALIFVFKFRNWMLILKITVVIIVTGILNQILKEVFNRQRPIDMQLINVSSESYPSGHAMSAIAFYGFLIYIAYKHINDKWLRTGFIFICIIIILAIGFSRVYLGVHYPSDVIAGYVAGFFWLIISIMAIEGFSLYHNIKKGTRK